MPTQERAHPAIHPPLGARVYDAAGNDLGTIKELGAEHFKLDVPMAFDYWLPYTVVESERDDGIHLSVAEGALDAHKVDRAAEDVSPADVEESLSHTDNPLPMERRYDAQADYLLNPRPPL